MKKQLLKSALIAVAGVGLLAGSGWALTFGDGGTALEKVLDSITIAPNSGNTSVDVVNDMLNDNFDSYWNITASGGSVATVIIELSAYAPNLKFGVYDSSNSLNAVEIFGGAATAGNQVTLGITSFGDIYINHVDTGINFGSTTFGYYLESPALADGSYVKFYSDTTLNVDNVDHMAAYQGTNTDTVQIAPWAPGLWTNNEYVLAWEDLYGGGDADYEDFVVMVESVDPVPEPTTMLLFGSGLLGLAAVARKRKGN